jgi:hypothetical protein
MSVKTWFSRTFGFLETNFNETRDGFSFDPETLTLTSKANQKTFFVGPFECPSLKELHDRLSSSESPRLGSLVFKELVGDVRSLHLEAKNNGAVFMVASQFNALEMVGPGVTPEHGITDYIKDQTQVLARVMSDVCLSFSTTSCRSGVGSGEQAAHSITAEQMYPSHSNS